MEIQPEELLLEISIRETPSEKVNSERALLQFVERYKDYLRRLIFTVARDNEDLTEDLYSLFILDIWEKAGSYDDKRSTESDTDKKIKFWLGYRFKAVQRRLREELMDDSTPEVFVSTNDITWTEEETEEGLFEGREILQGKLELALLENKVLNKKEIDILKTSYQYNNEIPKDIRLMICKEYSITETSIRTIRFKAKKKVRDFASKRIDFPLNIIRL